LLTTETIIEIGIDNLIETVIKNYFHNWNILLIFWLVLNQQGSC